MVKHWPKKYFSITVLLLAPAGYAAPFSSEKEISCWSQNVQFLKRKMMDKFQKHDLTKCNISPLEQFRIYPKGSTSVYSVCQNILNGCKWFFFCISLLLPCNWKNEWNTTVRLRGNVATRKSFIVAVKTSVIKDIIPIYYEFHHTCSDHKAYILRACHVACAVFAVTLNSNGFSMQLRE